MVSLSGATFDDTGDCTPVGPVSTLEIHGTSDNVIQFGGGTLPGANGPYPGAADTAAAWAGYNGCDGSTVAPILTVGDFMCFMQQYAAGDLRANCDRSATSPPALNIADYMCFLQSYSMGCP